MKPFLAGALRIARAAGYTMLEPGTDPVDFVRAAGYRVFSPPTLPKVGRYEPTRGQSPVRYVSGSTLAETTYWIDGQKHTCKPVSFRIWRQRNRARHVGVIYKNVGVSDG